MVFAMFPSLLSKILLYADDIFLLHPVNSPDDLLTIQHDLIASRYLTFNPMKSKYKFFSFKPLATFNHFASQILLLSISPPLPIY